MTTTPKTPKLFTQDYCKHGHDIRDKATALMPYKQKATDTTLRYRCRKCFNKSVNAQQKKIRALQPKYEPKLLRQDFCKNGHDIRDKATSLFATKGRIKKNGEPTISYTCRKCSYNLVNGYNKQARLNSKNLRNAITALLREKPELEQKVIDFIQEQLDTK